MVVYGMLVKKNKEFEHRLWRHMGVRMKVKKANIPIVSISIFFVGVGFIILGMAREEHITVLRKAIAICLECIGIG